MMKWIVLVYILFLINHTGLILHISIECYIKFNQGNLLLLQWNSCIQTVILFLTQIMVGEENKNKIVYMHFYFYFNFWEPEKNLA